MLFASPAWDAPTYWSLDLETGGLDPHRDAILAVGMVPIRDRHVRIGEGFRTLVRPMAGARVDPRSVEAHQLTAAETAAAPAIDEVLERVFSHFRAGEVLLAHHAKLDVGFLKEAARITGARWPGPRVVDTVPLLLRAALRERRHHPELPADPPPLNLRAARRRLGLPDYPAHDPLADAVATAELFLVLRESLGARTLRELR